MAVAAGGASLKLPSVSAGTYSSYFSTTARALPATNVSFVVR